MPAFPALCRRAALLLGLGLGPALDAGAAPAQPPQITWLLPDFAPASLVVAGQPTRGFSDLTLRYLISHWPTGTRHQIVVANSKRIWQQLEHGQASCHAATLRTPEREPLAYFSNTHLLPPLQLVFRRERIDALPLNAAGAVNLPRLLADPGLRGALIGGRSYGPQIDRQLQMRQADANVQVYSPPDLGARVLQMLALGRADYSIEYDFALRYQGQREPLLRKTLQSLPIEGAGLNLVAVACPRTPWGLAVIRQVNELLATPAARTVLREALQPWLTPMERQRYGAPLEAFVPGRSEL